MLSGWASYVDKMGVPIDYVRDASLTTSPFDRFWNVVHGVDTA